MTAIELILIVGIFGAVGCAGYWHKRWANAIEAERRAERKIAELQGKILDLSAINTNRQWRIDRKGPL